MSRLAIRFAERHDFDWYADRLGEGVYRKPNDGYFACPVHGGSDSLHVWQDGRGVGVYCFGCGATQAEIDEALDDAPIQERTVALRVVRPWVRGEVIARYVYTDAAGAPLYRKNRHEPKAFSFQTASSLPPVIEGPVQHDGMTLWNWGLHVEPLPYNLPSVLASQVVTIAGGEKDVDALNAAGLVATCSPFGEMNWPEKAEFTDPFLGKQITIVADRDETGYLAAAKLATYFARIAATLRVVEVREGKDAFDHLEAGYGLDDFLVAKSV